MTVRPFSAPSDLANLFATLSTSWNSADFAYRSSLFGSGDLPNEPLQSEATAWTQITGEDTTMSGFPSAHSPGPTSFSGGGASFGLPSGAPASAHLAINSISSSDSELSSFTA